jgi:hypothetical protein
VIPFSAQTIVPEATIMCKPLSPLRHPIMGALGILAWVLFSACETGDDGGNGPVETGPNEMPEVTLKVRHSHYPEANRNSVVVDDIPDPITILLNGIPGRFGGRPTNDHLFDTALARGASFTIPWARLLQVPGTQPRPFIKEPGSMDSVSPASVKIMRVGTFAEAVVDQGVYPDSGFEAYGFFDVELEIGATAMYFSGPATIHSDFRLCDSTRFLTHLDIPAAGFYFLYLNRSGGNLGLEMLPTVNNLVFEVMTASDINSSYTMAEYTRLWGCFYDEGQGPDGAGKTGGAGKSGGVGPLSYREWFALSR